MKTSWLFALLILASARPLPAAAATDDGVVLGSRPGLSLGGRGMYFKPKDTEGSWSGGAQVRFHLTSAFALEGSADVRQDRFGDTVVDLIPVQASLLAYLFPGKMVSPYLLGGGGGTTRTSRRARRSTTARTIASARTREPACRRGSTSTGRSTAPGGTSGCPPTGRRTRRIRWAGTSTTAATWSRAP